ncbi:hypothetical protein FI667_g4413, partial [Globisporangium splendens]
MNSLLFLYLNLVRGPRLMREQHEREEAARLAQEEADRASGKLKPVDNTICKKCDGPIDLKNARAVGSVPKCDKCLEQELEERKAAIAQMQKDMRMTPFLWFQLFVCLAGLLTFIHRNYFPFF